MVRKSNILKTLIIVPIILYRKVNLLLPGNKINMQIAELFLQQIFAGNPSRIETDVVIVMFGLMEVIVFSILFGTYIYQDLYENSVYIFTRQKSRMKWFINRCMQLFLYSALYNVLFILITLLLCIINSNQKIDFVAIRIAFITFILIHLFSFWTTLVINLLSIWIGATASFIVNYITLLVLSFFAINHEVIPIIRSAPFLLSINPVANVIIHWEAGIGEGLFPAVFFIVLIGITMLIGGKLISVIDISLENKEK